jgi:hypothetical protein
MRISFYSITFALIVFTSVMPFDAMAQGLYTARGFWEEYNKPIYREIKQKQSVGDPLTLDESGYLKDYEEYLNSYYQRLSDDEKARYQQMKEQWDRELLLPQKKSQPFEEEFEWRGRDRAINIAYGLYYGLSIALITELEGPGAAAVPLVMGGLWALGPVINPQKYENIDRSVLRANNSGKLLGLIYGGSLGLLIGGDSESTDKIVLGLSTLGSIGLGEAAFQIQKNKRFSEGHIELMRHYGIIGPWLGIAALGSIGSENVNLYGASLLAGGAAGLLIGNKQSMKYPYTRGDVDNISTFTVATTGIGFAISAEILQDDASSALLLIPAAGTVLGTILGQKAVKGVNLSKKQGSTISYGSGGSALIGLGIAALIQSPSPAVWIGIPSVFALATQQILFSKYKRENLANQTLSGRLGKDHRFDFTVKVTPENYFVNKQMAGRTNIPGLNPNPTQSLVNFKLAF